MDSGCRKLTAAWVREAAQKNPEVETCDFFEGLERAAADAVRNFYQFRCHSTVCTISECTLIVCRVGMRCMCPVGHMHHRSYKIEWDEAREGVG